nr:probable protein phosphatase 2C 5 [Ipomoea batatas]
MSEAEVTMTKQKPTSVAVPLGTLIGRELRNESKVEKPTVKYGQAALAKKGDDYFLIKPDCQRISGSSTTSFSIFAIFDGHNGISAAIFAKENLLNNVLSAIPQGLDREEWLQALPRALVAGFVKTDIEFQQKGETSGWKRMRKNEEERECVTANGGEVGRLNECSGGIRPWQGCGVGMTVKDDDMVVQVADLRTSPPTPLVSAMVRYWRIPKLLFGEFVVDLV